MIFILEVGKVVLNIIYMFIKLFPTKKKIVFISRQFNEPSQEIELIAQEMKINHPEYEFVLLCHTLDGKANASLKTKIQYGFHMFVQMYHIATSRVVLLDTYCMAVSILHHKKNLKVVQMWHSMGTMKLFGYTALNKEEGSDYKLAQAMCMHKNYDYVFVSSMAYADHLASGMGVDVNKMVVKALPRTDMLLSEEYERKKRVEIYGKYPQLKHKKNMVYVPTFRMEEADFQQALDELLDNLTKEGMDYNIIVKLHPLSKASVSRTDVILAPEFSSFDMLFVADIVISDYSCIVYEAAIRDTPLYFYAFDYDSYEGKRGLAIDYEHELPEPMCKDAAELVERISERNYNKEKLREFAEKYVVCTGHATKDIVEFLVNL